MGFTVTHRNPEWHNSFRIFGTSKKTLESGGSSGLGLETATRLAEAPSLAAS